MPSSTTSSSSQKKIDRYSMIKVIGKGTFGKAILVKEKATGQLYIMKQINISTLSKKERHEAVNEVKVLSALRNDYIVSYVTSFMSQGRLCIIMQYASNGDLYQRIKQQRGRPFDEAQILKWFVQLCLAVKHCHDRRILHRDLKTQNIFLDQHDNVQLGDFGISKVLHSTMECARTMVGTPYYLSPELCREEPYNNKSDIWSLGCILYELCTGKHAFEGINMKALVGKILRGIYPPISSRYSRDLRNLIDCMLQKSPRRRPSVNTILKAPYIRDIVRKMVDRKTYEKIYGIESTQQQGSGAPVSSSEKERSADKTSVPTAAPQEYIVPLAKAAPRVHHVDLHADILSKYKSAKPEPVLAARSDEVRSSSNTPPLKTDLQEKFKVYEDKKRALMEKFAARKVDKENDPLKGLNLRKNEALREPVRQNLVLNQILLDHNRPHVAAALDGGKRILAEKDISNKAAPQFVDLTKFKPVTAWETKENLPEEPRKQEKPLFSKPDDMDETRQARLKRLNELQARRKALEEKERLLNEQKRRLVEKQEPPRKSIESPLDAAKGTSPLTNEQRRAPVTAKPVLTKTIRQSVQKFKLNGATLRKNGVNDATASLCFRIESLRMHLESELGTRVFCAVYDLVKACDSSSSVDEEIAIERKIESILGRDKLCFLSLVHQLMFCEDAFHEQQ